MNEHRAISSFVALAAFACAWPATAGLVKLQPEVTITGANESVTGMLSYAVNGTTGKRVVCYDFDTGSLIGVRCRRLAADGSADGAPVQIDVAAYTMFGFFSHIEQFDVALADDDGIYLVTTLREEFADERTLLEGWDAAGAPRFPTIEIDAGEGDLDVSIAAQPAGPFVFTTNYGGGLGIAYYVHAFSTTGVAQPRIEIARYPSASLDFCEFDISGDIAANGAGDIAVTWLKPNAAGGCRGSLMARTMRVGVPPGPERQVTRTVRDHAGVDVSPNDRPTIAALDDDRFVLAWFDQPMTNTAMIDRRAAIVAAPQPMLPGIDFTFAANPATSDYAVVQRDQTGACVLNAQLAFDGSLVPVTRFGVGSCAGSSRDAVQFTRDGHLSIARSYFDRVTLADVVLPTLIEVNTVSLSEGNPSTGPVAAAVSVTLMRPHPNDEDVTVSYVTRNGTAMAGSDFDFARGAVTFAGATHETEQTITVPIVPDTRYEDDERFAVELELPVNAVIRQGDERADVTILDDDVTPPITADCTGGDPLHCRVVDEPGPGETTTFAVRLDLAEPVGTDLQISYATIDGTATAGLDYAQRNGTVQITAGATTATIALTLIGDDLPELTETFRLRLSAPDGVTLAASELVFEIINDPVCFLEVAPNGIAATEAGGNESLTVTTGDGCAWSVATSDPWIALKSAPENTGSGTVSLAIAAFIPPPGVVTRSGAVTVTLASPTIVRTIIVDQDGACDFAIDPATQAIPVGGGDFTFAVTPNDARCDWFAAAPAPWIAVLSPIDPVAGAGSVSYRVNANAGVPNVEAGPRTIALASEEFTHTITQAGCTYDIDTHVVTATAAGDESFDIAITAPAVCQWTAVSQASWILVRHGASGAGDANVEIFVLDNPTVASRTGNVTIGDETLVVTQAGLPCSYAMAPTSITACPDGRAFEIAIAATDGCAWTLGDDADWLTLAPTLAGTGDDDADGTVAANLSEVPRSVAVQLRAADGVVATTKVNQEAYLTLESFDALPADWTFAPSGAWAVASGHLVASSLGGSATALDGDVRCAECELRTGMTVTSASSAAGDVMTLVGWYADELNHVGFAMDEFSNRWTLFERVNGVRRDVVAEVAKLLPNTRYDVRLYFDGTTVVAELDGAALLQMVPQRTALAGSAALRVAGANGRFDALRVSAIASVPPSGDADAIFRGGFEVFEVPNLSQCVLDD